MHRTKNVDDLFKLIIQDEKLNILQKKILLNEVRKLRPPEEDRWVYRTVVWILGIVAIGTVLYPFVRSIPEGQDIPGGLLAIGSAAMGALAGYLTPTIKTKRENHPESPPVQRQDDDNLPPSIPDEIQGNTPVARS